MNELNKCYRCGCDEVYKIIEITISTGDKIRSGVCELCLICVIDEINKKDHIVLLSEKNILRERGYVK